MPRKIIGYKWAITYLEKDSHVRKFFEIKKTKYTKKLALFEKREQARIVIKSLKDAGHLDQAGIVKVNIVAESADII